MKNVLSILCQPSNDKDTENESEERDDNDTDTDDLEKLKQRYLRLQRQRQSVALARQQCQRHKTQVVIPKVEELRLHRQVALETYQSLVTQKQSIVQYLQLAVRWNVWNDCFFIWHYGPWATINGARLGGIPSHLPMTISTTHHHRNGGDSSTTIPSRRALTMWSSVAPAPSDGTADNHHSNHKVPWPEINAALGHVVLLLKLLQDQCGWKVTHQLLPMASTSQIGIRRRIKSIFGTTSELQPPVIHNLYFEESSFSLFKGGALRQFQVGLVALLECMVEINAQLHDKTIVLPHAIHIQEEAATATIGGVSMAFAESEDFTRACKYLLTNIKWLVAYTVKHHVER